VPARPTDTHGARVEGISWLAEDEDGHVALFSTAGAGYSPAEFLRDTDAHYDAIQAILALPASTTARFVPEIAPDLVNTWKLVAERGLFAFDCDPNGGPYWLVAAPQHAVRVNELPTPIAEVVRRISLGGCFRNLATVTADRLAQNRAQ
jgi:hypothetical protein